MSRVRTGRGRSGYRMTPARRAALKKAQLASARKRKRKQVVRRVGILAAGASAIFVTKHVNRWAGNPRLIKKDFRDLKNFGSDVSKKGKRVVQKVQSKQSGRRLKKYAKSTQQYTLW